MLEENFAASGVARKEGGSFEPTQTESRPAPWAQEPPEPAQTQSRRLRFPAREGCPATGAHGSRNASGATQGHPSLVSTGRLRHLTSKMELTKPMIHNTSV